MALGLIRVDDIDQQKLMACLADGGNIALVAEAMIIAYSVPYEDWNRVDFKGKNGRFMTVERLIDRDGWVEWYWIGWRNDFYVAELRASFKGMQLVTCSWTISSIEVALSEAQVVRWKGEIVTSLAEQARAALNNAASWGLCYDSAARVYVPDERLGGIGVWDDPLEPYRPDLYLASYAWEMSVSERGSG